MPKMKSIKAASKRFKRTGTGKFKRNKAYSSHLLKCKSTKRKRNLRKSTIASPSDAKRIEKMIVK